MNKLLLLILLTATTLQAQLNYSQWNTVETKDSFGDVTGESVKMVFAKGTFSNSATSSKKLIAKFQDDGKYLYLDLYEYGTPPQAKLIYKGSFGSIKIKDEKGVIHTIKCFASKTTTILFQKKEYEKLKKLISENKVLKFNVNQSNFSKYGSSTYNFILKLN